MTNVKYLIRKGHLGDVILTEPIARYFQLAGARVVLVTEFTHVGPLIPTYDEVLPYSILECPGVIPEDAALTLAYEPYPHLPYVTGYAASAGLVLEDPFPLISSLGPSPIKEPYFLIAPRTSTWARHSRQWPLRRFRKVASLIADATGIRPVFLESHHTFAQMAALIEHCTFFLGNDSAPGIMAQCYKRPSFIIFGSTDPFNVIFSNRASAVVHEVGCNGCRQYTRDSVIQCNTPICLNGLHPEIVSERILSEVSSFRNNL